MKSIFIILLVVIVATVVAKKKATSTDDQSTDAGKFDICIRNCAPTKVRVKNCQGGIDGTCDEKFTTFKGSPLPGTCSDDVRMKGFTAGDALQVQVKKYLSGWNKDVDPIDITQDMAGKTLKLNNLPTKGFEVETLDDTCEEE